MIDTKIKTKVVTNTQLAVAILAAFMAGGLAFAAAPAAKPALKCGVNKVAFVQAVKGCARGQASGADITCHDGTKKNYRPNKCMTIADLQTYAKTACANRCNRPPAEPPAPPVVAIPAGTLSLSMDNGLWPNGSDILAYPYYILNGSTGFVARVRVTAGPEEAVNLRSLAFNIVTADIEALRPHISSFSIYGRQILDNAPVLGRMTLDNMRADELNYQIPAGTTDYIYVKVHTNEINANTATGTPFQAVGFTLSLRDPQPSQGLVSATNIQPTIQNNTQSTRVDILPIIITDLGDNSVGNQQLVGGNQTLFSFSAFAMGGNNRDHLGDLMKANIMSLKLRIDTDIPEENFSNLEFCRVETDTCIDLIFSTTTPYLLTSFDPSYTSILLQDSVEFVETESNTIDSGEGAHFIVRGTVIPEADSTVQIRILDVNNGGFAYNFNWEGDDSPDAIIRDLRHNHSQYFNPSYPDILGWTLVQ